jgi:hypothetical protein
VERRREGQSVPLALSESVDGRGAANGNSRLSVAARPCASNEPSVDIKLGPLRARAVGWPAIGALMLLTAVAAVLLACYLGILLPRPSRAGQPGEAICVSRLFDPRYSLRSE